jgi:dipeptidyl aminopeptidase/acylaminoacyl peptidase
MKLARIRRTLTPGFAVVTLLAAAGLLGARSAEATFPGANGPIAVSGRGLECEDESTVSLLWPNTGRSRLLTNCGDGFALADWFPSGRKLLVLQGRRPATMRVDGSHVRFLPALDAFDLPSLSPDGRWFVFRGSVGTGTRFGIWRVTLRGTHARRLGSGFFPRWSPDGRKIAFLGRDGLMVMSAKTGRARRVLLPVEPSLGSLDWSPDSRRLLYCDAYPDNAIYAIRVDGKGVIRRVVPDPAGGTAYQFSAVWSPDGRQIAFARSRSPASEEVEYSVWTATAKGRRVRRIYDSGSLDNELSSYPTLAWGRGVKRGS